MSFNYLLYGSVFSYSNCSESDTAFVVFFVITGVTKKFMKWHKRRQLYLKTHPYRAVNTFHLGYKNQSVYAVSGTSADRFIDPVRTAL
jgi:hypothetical protein